jgi:CO/xanthine dehydrogenase FAD-binding subunit
MPVTQIDRYHRPTELESAWQLLRDGGDAVRLLAGGTDLVVSCPPEVRELVDLQALDLRSIEVADDGTLTIGAMVTFTDLLEHEVAARHAGGVLSTMLVQVGSVLHRNSATVGGHIARGRLSDVIPVLIALDAVVRLHDGEDREVPLVSYHGRPRAPHLVTAAVLPALPPASAASFVRFSRAAFDIALVNACCRVDRDGAVVTDARVVVGETAALGRRVESAESELVGHPLTPERVAAAAAAVTTAGGLHGDRMASAAYRTHLAGVAVTRCLQDLARRASDHQDGAP